MIEWLRIPYQDYGRTPEGCDCWGLVRLVRQALRGDLLPSFGSISPKNKDGLTAAAREVERIEQFAEKTAGHIKPGAIATVWRGPLCLHVGIVVEVEDRLAVLETGRRIGVRWKWLQDFENTYSTVRYHDNDH